MQMKRIRALARFVEFKRVEDFGGIAELFITCKYCMTESEEKERIYITYQHLSLDETICYNSECKRK